MPSSNDDGLIPSWFDAMTKAELDQEKRERAISLSNDLIQRHPEAHSVKNAVVNLLILHANADGDTRSLDRASAMNNEVLNADPFNADAMIAKAELEMRAGEMDKAIETAVAATNCGINVTAMVTAIELLQYGSEQNSRRRFESAIAATLETLDQLRRKVLATEFFEDKSD